MEGYEKVLLRGYAIVEKVIAGIDDLVERRALASFWSRESCESVAEKILALTETKGELLILREKLGKSLRALCKEDLELIASGIGRSFRSAKGSSTFPAIISESRNARSDGFPTS